MTASNSTIKKWLIAYGPVLVWASVIFLFSAQPGFHGSEVNVLDFVMKKTAHVVEYFILALLSYRALYLTTSKSFSKKYWWIPILFCFLYAISDEWHQSWVPGRYPSPRDIGFDMVGVGLAFFVQSRYSWLSPVRSA